MMPPQPHRASIARKVKAPADFCPACRIRTRPWRTWLADATGDTTLYGDYRCRCCSHTWWTGWDPEALV